jgi:transposase-like protein
MIEAAFCGRKDLAMKKQRRFPAELKRQVIEELLSGITSPAQLCRRHNISSGLLYHWKKQYSRGRFGNEPTQEAALKDRIAKLEQMLGRLTMENEFLKKALENTLERTEQKESSLPTTDFLCKRSEGGANS